jgi:hypothetical protein
MPGSWRRGACLVLVLTAAAAVLPAYGDEAEVAPAPPVEATVTAREVDELLRRETNLVVIYGPDGTAEVRAYADGGRPRIEADSATPNAEASAEEREEKARLRAQALGAGDAEERVVALHALVGTEVGRQTALDVLARDREPEILKNALDVLTGYVTLPLEPILTVARNEDPSVRIQALELLSLHRANDPRVEQVLTRAAATDTDEDVRESARALIGSADPR